MIRSFAFPFRTAAFAAVVFAVLVASATALEDADDLIRRGKSDLAAGRVTAAEAAFARAAEVGAGEERREAWCLQAGVVRSGADAESLYRRVLDEDVADEWRLVAALELAKIEYALGRYETARAVLRDFDACRESDEACLFEGMASVMARDYAAAAPPLERVRKGRLKTWAAVSLAEASEGAGDHDDACARYEALARSRVNPTAWYRHAECLESARDDERARREFEALQEAFPQTPEAVRAAEKMTVAAPAPEPPAAPAETAAPAGPGYTIQFGSFGDRGNAIKLYAKIKRTHPGIRIDSELVNFREVFRVRYGHYATREEASAAAASMSDTVDETYTIMPVVPRVP